jgi:GTP-binding protein EngB required for normal cell division
MGTTSVAKRIMIPFILVRLFRYLFPYIYFFAHVILYLFADTIGKTNLTLFVCLFICTPPVDLPGFGYAEVPEHQRRKWSDFMQHYVSNRENLRVVFHLVDSRHGPSSDDERIMKDIGTILCKKQVAYVIALTKSDKIGKVSQKVMDSLRVAMKNANISSSPILLTSAETKLGRDDVWRYLKLAAEF